MKARIPRNFESTNCQKIEKAHAAAWKLAGIALDKKARALAKNMALRIRTPSLPYFGR